MYLILTSKTLINISNCFAPFIVLTRTLVPFQMYITATV